MPRMSSRHQRDRRGRLSVAPSTLAFYEAFAPLMHGKHALDAGAGLGLGTRVLCDYAPHVTAIDSDARALELARVQAPGAEFLHADLCHGSAVDLANTAFLIDVLGQVARPEAALRSLRACLPGGSRLFLAEPRAHPSQRLLPPARCAFAIACSARVVLPDDSGP